MIFFVQIVQFFEIQIGMEELSLRVTASIMRLVFGKLVDKCYYCQKVFFFCFVRRRCSSSFFVSTRITYCNWMERFVQARLSNLQHIQEKIATHDVWHSSIIKQSINALEIPVFHCNDGVRLIFFLGYWRHRYRRPNEQRFLGPVRFLIICCINFSLAINIDNFCTSFLHLQMICAKKDFPGIIRTPAACRSHPFSMATFANFRLWVWGFRILLRERTLSFSEKSKNNLCKK